MENLQNKTYKHGLKVGDVLYSSWGYDQTNLDFFVIVAATESTIRIKECTMEKTKEDGVGWLCRNIAYDPKTAKPVESSWCIKDQNGKGDLKKIVWYNYNGHEYMHIRFLSNHSLRKYEGEKLYESWYA